jgi:hypothetical protein
MFSYIIQNKTVRTPYVLLIHNLLIRRRILATRNSLYVLGNVNSYSKFSLLVLINVCGICSLQI